jgi:class 3 adenylate cyclase
VQDFFTLVDRLSEAGAEERARLEAEIWRRFGVDKAILALDMSQFSLSVRRSGILPYLALIRRMQALTAPLVAVNRGHVIKYEADNLFASFDEPADAVRAAIAVNQIIVRGEERFTVAVGIDYGRILLVDGADCYGDTMNIACKLGEDVAAPGEILLSDAAARRLRAGSPFTLKPQQVSVSGLEIPVHSVEYTRTNCRRPTSRPSSAVPRSTPPPSPPR